MADALLKIEGVSKRFGGVIASGAISLAVPKGELHAVIGPNGAGKTTLIAQLAGEIAPDAGRIRFAGRDVTALPVDRRSRLGLGRSFQITSLFLDVTALDNVALAVQAHAGHSFRFWRAARRDPALREPARAALGRVGLAGRITVLVYGRVIASGAPAAIRGDAEVRKAYLGEQTVVTRGVGNGR